MCFFEKKMRSYLMLFIGLFSVLGIAFGTKKDYYTAGVFEKALLRSVEGKTPLETLEINLNLFEKAAKEAAERNVDILAFGEFALYPYQQRSELANFMEHVPNPKIEKTNPCKQFDLFHDRPSLYRLSCIARKYGLYVVANMVDKQPCTDQAKSCDVSNVDDCQSFCPYDGVFMYNTDVAFDRDGNLIARYHKNHPYYEELNIPVNPEMITFKTEFGTFGLIVCFDSVFKHSVNLVENYGVDTLLFITHWFDDILPLNAIEWQQSWAIANKVNMIAANCYTPGFGTIGSGIYSKKYGAINYSYNVDGKSKLVVGRVPLGNEKKPYLRNGETDVVVITETEVYEKEEFGENFPEQCYIKLLGPAKNNLTEYRCYKLQLQRYTLTKLESGKHEMESCNNGFCCLVKYSADIKNEDYYLASFNGLNTVEGSHDWQKDFYKWQEETCLVVRCDPYNGKTCVLLPSQAKSIFDYVELKATFSAERIYPSVSKTHNRLAPKHEWNLEKMGDTVVLSYHKKYDDPLLKVGLMGRCYNKDPPWEPYYKF